MTEAQFRTWDTRGAGMSEKAGEKSEMQFRLMEADGRDYKFNIALQCMFMVNYLCRIHK